MKHFHDLKTSKPFKFQTIEGRNNWSTLVAALRILLDGDEDRLFLAYQGGLGNLLEVISPLINIRQI